MARANVPLLAFQRGLVDPKALARVDLDRMRLSAEVFTNWIPATQGSMAIRPGTKFFGSSLNDTGAYFIEFVASTTDVAMPEITNGKMRVWLGSDPHALALLERPNIATTFTIGDTGWVDASTGGFVASAGLGDQIPIMDGYTKEGVTVSAGSEEGVGNHLAWKAVDNDNSTYWQVGSSDTGLWWWKVDFGTGNAKALKTHTIRAHTNAANLLLAPETWELQGNDVDTGDGWTTEVSVTGQTGWSVAEKRTFQDTGYSDTGANSWQYWRLQVSDIESDGGQPGEQSLTVGELEMLLDTGPPTPIAQAGFTGTSLTLNAGAIGSLAKATKRVIVDTGDRGVEHGLDIQITRGPVTFRTGSTAGDDDYISETILGTGDHNLAFTPTGNFHVTVQSDLDIDRIIQTLGIGDTGTVEIASAWSATDLDCIRYDQSADVVYVDCARVHPQKIERRGTGRSWSAVEYQPNNGPFRAFASSTAKLSVSQTFGNTKLSSDVPFFRSAHIGALIRMFHDGQSGVWNLGALDAATGPIQMTGITDTGTAGANRERRIVISTTGTWAGTFTVQKSVDGSTLGFHDTDFTDTGTATITFDDPDDNITVWYRVRLSAYTSGAAVVTITYKNGGVNGIGRITAFNSNTDVDFEVLSRFSDTGPTESWQEGAWSALRGYPSAVALHGGRLCHAGGANLYLSVSDDFENFDDETIGDAGPIIRSLGSGPVDNIYYLVSLLRLVAGTTGSEIALRASSLDEVLTPSNANAKGFSTQGSADLRSLKLDNHAIFTQRSKQRIFLAGFTGEAAQIGDLSVSELTILVPDLLKEGVVSMAIQRQPDTRLHCVLGDGTVGIMTYDREEEVLCWSKWEGDTGTNASVERAMALPATNEDAIYYHVRRTINGATKRYFEKWAKESEAQGDTGLSWIADCAKSYTDTGRIASLTGFDHLAGASVVVWADDTGQTDAGKDLSPDVAGVQTTYAVDTGAGTITLGEAVHHAVAGKGFNADWKSTKLAYAAEFGTALSQMKRTDHIAFVLHQTHNNGLFYGNDTGNLDPLPRVSDEGAEVDADKIFAAFDEAAMPFPGLWDADSRVHLRAKSPRPATVLAAIPNVNTEEKI